MKKLKEITFHWEEIIFLFITFSQRMNLNMEMQKNVDAKCCIFNYKNKFIVYLKFTK